MFQFMSLKGICILFISSVLLAGSLVAQEVEEEEITERRITVSEFKDKMMGGWIGQMVGVGWGAPTEFQWVNAIIPDEDVPEWNSAKHNLEEILNIISF